MHWEWKNCPTAWKGQYTRGSGKPTIVLEAVASQDLWIWRAFFGAPAPKVKYIVNGRQYNLAYYLTDGIYPDWATFIQSSQIPQDPKASLFATYQEAVRKDVKHAFGVLQARFAIVKNPALMLNKVKIGNIMRACIILHNMIVEGERDGYTQYDMASFAKDDSNRTSQVDCAYSTDIPSNLANMMGNVMTIRNESGELRPGEFSRLGIPPTGTSSWLSRRQSPGPHGRVPHSIYLSIHSLYNMAGMEWTAT
ncbi:PREDICTED: uncharacterized protein LOC104733755 [Camelina sativa]|uniref:Uncharacterized protein LOC104733755 n=1 Tax=Camelina sativa TaxID=90675 RepID=A0ABM0V6G8_CAMSA|nr:PREDICTED: uncharacterized protein LOC104733755 [Camelina sativa]